MCDFQQALCSRGCSSNTFVTMRMFYLNFFAETSIQTKQKHKKTFSYSDNKIEFVLVFSVSGLLVKQIQILRLLTPP